MYELFQILQQQIENKYGIPVIITDVPEPFTGDLDGASIYVDIDEDIDSALFILVHLFGHTVQWSLCEDARRIGQAVPEPTDEAFLKQLRIYEEQACRYSLQLFHDVGVNDFDQWLSDFAACDFAYLDHFYRTGEKRDARSFWKPGQRILEPLPLPEFTPRRWKSRLSGIVL
ncbi:MAG TPA: hypothetical protein PKD64_16540 [Pirellulaceae bacterium]|nr:hypothetical protein [Pirellulaceae bacterium]HMO93799.1 hypothetical protein [Pirellulaceae bacterium]HMP70607.1 hypothetical protein [Pirellulaceae bacterium]